MTVKELLELYQGDEEFIEINTAKNYYNLRQTISLYGLKEIDSFYIDDSSGYLLIFLM